MQMLLRCEIAEIAKQLRNVDFIKCKFNSKVSKNFFKKKSGQTCLNISIIAFSSMQQHINLIENIVARDSENNDIFAKICILIDERRILFCMPSGQR